MSIQDTNNRFSLRWIVENLLGILLLSALAVPLVAWSWRICFTLFITLKQEVFQQRDGRDVPEVKSWKNFHTKLFVKSRIILTFPPQLPPSSLLLLIFLEAEVETNFELERMTNSLYKVIITPLLWKCWNLIFFSILQVRETWLKDLLGLWTLH